MSAKKAAQLVSRVQGSAVKLAIKSLKNLGYTLWNMILYYT